LSYKVFYRYFWLFLLVEQIMVIPCPTLAPFKFKFLRLLICKRLHLFSRKTCFHSKTLGQRSAVGLPDSGKLGYNPYPTRVEQKCNVPTSALGFCLPKNQKSDPRVATNNISLKLAYFWCIFSLIFFQAEKDSYKDVWCEYR